MEYFQQRLKIFFLRMSLTQKSLAAHDAGSALYHGLSARHDVEVIDSMLYMELLHDVDQIIGAPSVLERVRLFTIIVACFCGTSGLAGGIMYGALILRTKVKKE
mmetsp:Transcript_10619/g.21376  ORF Transcript_10619/g.21376 Transcript_10619/m.21376 type:complete len:104 (-) Transcript_10619:880-1191(-)